MDLSIIALLLSAFSLYLLRHRLFLNVNIQTQVLPEENLAQRRWRRPSRVSLWMRLPLRLHWVPGRGLTRLVGSSG